MSAEETELEMVQRHVREGKGHLTRQRALIAQRGARGLPTGEAQTLLDTFEAVQHLHEAHLARLRGRQS